MKSGDRVILSEPMAELAEGLKGTVVVYREKPPWMMHECNVLAVLFDSEKFPCVSREINNENVQVVSKCKLI